MKKYFIASLIKNGIIGGSVIIDSYSIVYCTGKLSIPHEYRRLEMKYEDIYQIVKGWSFILPTVTIKMKNGTDHKLVIFFSRKRFLNILKSMGVSI